jgi:hypothetical protein
MKRRAQKQAGRACQVAKTKKRRSERPVLNEGGALYERQPKT